jgi:diguanylate cyclase (GGDEF)-like protein
MRIDAIRFPPRAECGSEDLDDGARIANITAQLSALRAIVDELNVGLVLLDQERRVQFINRAFRRFWRVPDDMVRSDLTFAELMYHGRGMRAYAVSPDRLDDYVAKQLDLIQTGEERPLHIRFGNGAVIQFRCKALPNGSRLLSYGNVSELAQHADALERLASVDGMTGLNNRRNFLALAEIEMSRFKRYGRPLALLMIDIDFFKSINDRYGHDAGDEVIKAVADILQNHKRTSDIVGRLGGEEFALILPESTFDSAVAAGDRLRQFIAERTINVHGRSIEITVSVGVSVCRGETCLTGELLKEADIALYEAKRTGRNRVCRFTPEKSSSAATANIR